MSIVNFKKQAKLIVQRSKEMGKTLSYQQSLELIATINGFKTWNALVATEEKKEKDALLQSKSEFVYYDLSYFYGRKDSGSYYVKVSRKLLEETIKKTYDEMLAVIIIAQDTNQLDKGEGNSIVEASEITEEEYNDLMGI